MAVGPSDEAVDTFTTITSLPKENAIAWLQANNNEVEKATNAFFDGGGVPLPPKAPTVQWSEGDFHADKTTDGQQGQSLESFSVHPPDTLNPDVFAAPSRPPSRVSNREGASATQQYAETEDEQLNRAMAMSLSESQTLPGQETGVTDLSKTAFGPAQREYYDTKKWSLTLPGAHTQEILLNPEPFDRRRQPGTPAFLKPAPDAPRLPALIKILHEIPIAREALLNTNFLLTDYGHDPQWWDGEPVTQLRVVNVDSGYQGAYGQDLINETQRLMAFLDKTERAYGSAEGVMKLQGRYADKDGIASFLEDWQKITAEVLPGDSLHNIFESRGVRRDPEDGDDKYQSFSCLPLNVSPGMVDKGFSLYNALDEVIWEEADGPEVFLKDIGNVVTFAVACRDTPAHGIGIDIPPVWYPDRYLESSIQKSKCYRDRRETLVHQYGHLEAARERLLKFNTPTKPAIDASSLLAKAMAHFEQTSTYLSTTKGNINVNGSTETDGYVQPDHALAQLKALNESITNKLKIFEQAKERLDQQEKENSLFYTQPTDDPETSPTNRYTLRGVATLAQILYVLEKAKPEADDDLISLESNEWQWWKLEYVSSDVKPVVTTKVSEEDVLKAARSESRSVLLVYADDTAVNHESTPLPLQLANFVRADNLSFQGELENFVQTTRESPGKRKATGDDQDDLITEHPRSPPFNREHFSDDSLDLNPPDYLDTPPSPTPMQPFRPLRPKPGMQGSSDDSIPISLRATDSTINSTYMVLDQDDVGQKGLEMKERGCGTSLLQGRTDISDGYKLGDYVPEINMEDEEDEDAQDGGDQQREIPRGRGTQEDTW